MNILGEILRNKHAEVEERKTRCGLPRLTASPLYPRRALPLKAALRGGDLAVIAEIKKASPSKNVIRTRFDPATIARQYVEGGASALSVLTDAKYFQGDISYIEAIRPLVPVPILRKDFIIDPYQVHEAKAIGADAVLLIAAALEPARLLALREEAASLGMDSLVEVHNEQELSDLPLDAEMLIGINNRDLTTFETDIETSIRLRQLIPGEVTVVSESGISSAEDIARLRSCGIHAVLIGETFMRAEHPGKALAEMLAEARQ